MFRSDFPKDKFWNRLTVVQETSKTFYILNGQAFYQNNKFFNSAVPAWTTLIELSAMSPKDIQFQFNEL
jgi:hypothetical protein